LSAFSPFRHSSFLNLPSFSFTLAKTSVFPGILAKPPESPGIPGEYLHIYLLAYDIGSSNFFRIFWNISHGPIRTDNNIPLHKESASSLPKRLSQPMVSSPAPSFARAAANARRSAFTLQSPAAWLLLVPSFFYTPVLDSENAGEVTR
jgi:hypothetical protein